MSTPSAVPPPDARVDTFVPRYGAHPDAAGGVSFRLWAPSADRVLLECEGQVPVAMTSAEAGEFVARLDCPVGSAYRYRVFVGDDDTGLAVPDPASRALRDGVDGWSLVTDPSAYTWQHPAWRGRPWEACVIYEVHLGAIGGMAGLVRRLPQLVELGVTAIELMPLAECPGTRNWGYDGVQPYAVASYYGTPQAFQALVDAIHDHGLMVFVDVVYNHFGPDGNFLPHYAKAFFRDDVATPWGAAIDFRRPQVRRFFIDNALMWLLDYRVDGLRFDAVHAIGDRDFLLEMATTLRTRVGGERHVHLMLENEHNQASLLGGEGYTAQWADDWHNVMHVLLTGEAEGYYADFVTDATAKLATAMGEGFVFQGQATRKGEARGEPSAGLPPTAFIDFLQNHDQIGNRALGERLSQLADADALAAATLLLLLSPKIPLLFMGEEWGSRRPFLFFTDYHDTLADAVREGRRREFAEFGAFEDPAQRERIPDPNAQTTFADACLDTAEAERPEHRDQCERLTAWLALRHAWVVPRLAGARALRSEVIGDAAVDACWQLGDGSTLRIAINLGPAAVNLAAPVPLLVASHADVAAALRAEQLPSRRCAVWLDARETTA
ncbi:malto-oligosyltrehalose trehalohydrolase [Salinicola endophyticus]|uniref:Malto-oligosyltrehalose trehalohydrolase n=1 Tax=Salinicola endophyticus TaxID=1949083 RepID=A0ABY8FED9_9GAMM|nr:malto-oligosyltrehalose trehalohydrolase [Salinicola endophyticus]WFF40350.1 malto-oligosyltrehalose trehalohydrolase [Salinicola endophyticus]